MYYVFDFVQCYCSLAFSSFFLVCVCLSMEGYVSSNISNYMKMVKKNCERLFEKKRSY